jgi:hypothetical protein
MMKAKMRITASGSLIGGADYSTLTRRQGRIPETAGDTALPTSGPCLD